MRFELRSRSAVGLLAGLALAATPLVASPLGRLGSPFALLVVLPALAVALEALGWSRAAAAAIRRIRRPIPRLLGAYAVWLGVSALLTLDVSAAAGASVAVEIADEAPETRRWHLWAAVLGSNAGSLLFPFSNLTNLVVLGGAGIGLAEFLETAWLPQIGAAVAVGAVLLARARRSGLSRAEDPAAQLDEAGPASLRPGLQSDRPALIGGLVALGGALGAIGAGLAGLDMAVPFALAAAILVAVTVRRGLIGPRDVAHSAPLAALAIVAAAALIGGPVAREAGLLPHPGVDPAGLTLALAAGGLVAAAVNNLPAAAFGAAWLVHAPAPVIVAYLVGTNVAAIATPHGSAATMLVRSGGASRGTSLPIGGHLRGAWRYALAGSGAALALLAVVR